MFLPRRKFLFQVINKIKPKRSGCHINLLHGKMKLAGKIRGQHGITIRLDLNAHRRQMLAQMKHLFHLFQIIIPIFHFLIVRTDIRIPCDAENASVYDWIRGKNLLNEGQHDFLDQKIFHPIAREKKILRQGMRNGNHAKRDTVLMLEQRCYKQFFILKMRERMMQIKNLRRKNR